MSNHALFVTYCAKDFLDGVQALTPMEELAYRRICDLIYTTGDRLPDDDRRLGWMTKTGKRWPAIKAVLLADGKITIADGFIHNKRCTLAIGEARQKIVAGSRGGTATAASGKSLRNLKRTPKQVPKRTAEAPAEAGNPSAPEANYLTVEPIDSGSKEEPAADAASGPKNNPIKAAVFDRGVAILGPQRRSLLGKLVKEHGEVAVLGAIVETDREPRADPAAYLIGCCKRGGEGKNGADYFASAEFYREQGVQLG